jgi:hypothetical protein
MNICDFVFNYVVRERKDVSLGMDCGQGGGPKAENENGKKKIPQGGDGAEERM